ncbi:putative glycoside hydrolase family 32 protein [Neofusicoccum parvum]|uniref:Putative glycoside hydrolase family 32 protein n=1 Tax=Botryosphaeria parva (strain UCR-NP2) TaxID=1287680 RepID=R1GSK1_BOTPV|nr:putative glycoside hydrolase family 32 protein [Neofusicoccum parvum UCRNP2]GME60573.1 putative glycoside hydrolase family 32 protein [Neofusicoccum parvum]
MKVSQAAAAGAALFAGANAQSSSSVYVQPTVPTGTPVPGNYTGGLRPQTHFSPPQHFMNDPNGCFVDANGTWHLYYQYNPTGIVAGNQHWGHATSQDLYHWENQQIAIFPPNNVSNIFSGSAVIDVNNTSGFFPDQDNGVVAIYTLNTPTKQVQEIAYSYDGGYTFIPYDANPVIDSTSTQFRDPKVIWYEDHWVMVIAYSQDFVIGIYTSLDLKEWTHASNFSHHGLLGLQYECPNMVEVPVNGTDETMYVLTISINPGAPLGGSITEYFPGHFNGTHFTAVDSAARIGDFAKDNYAAQFFYGTPSGSAPVSIAWASNWQYTQVAPTGAEGWRSVMSWPRRTYLANIYRVGWTLVQEPYDPSPVLGAELASNDSLVNASLVVDYSDVASNAIYFAVNVSGLPSSVSNISSTASLNFTALSPVSGESVAGGYFFGGDNPFWLDRGKTRGFDNPYFTDKFSVSQLLDPSGTWSLAGVIDRSILELFLDRATYSATATFFPVQPLTLFSIRTAGLPEGAKVEVKVWGLESAWAAYENENGTVVGNVTTGGGAMERRLVYEAGFEA